jgi:ABC-type transport system involved in multi-copper enzyme maturation permease subunit
MAFRGGLGPVFAYEWLTATRRWQMYAGRAVFVGVLLVGLAFVWINSFDKGAGLTTYQAQAKIGRTFVETLVFIELVMVMLTAPAAAAGAICLDKARGTLLHVLVTDLSDAEIVLGKLAARLVPVLGLVACSLPVLALGLLLGGIDPAALTGSFLVIVGVTVLGCALSLTFSVWGKKTHEVLLATYVVWAIWVVAIPGTFVVNFRAPFPGWLLKTNPVGLTVGAHDPSNPSSPGLGDQLLFLAAALLISAALVALAVARLRQAVIHQWGRPAQSVSARVRRGYGRGYGPTLDGNPVLWREWHRRRPSRWARIIWGLYIALAVGFSAVAIHIASPGSVTTDSAGVISGFVASIGLLLLSVSAATSLAEERAMGSLDVLLATPLPTSAIVWGKWWGTYRTVPLLAILPGMVAVGLANQTGRWLGPPLVVGVILAYGAAVTSLGLALATWVGRLSLALALCVGAVVGVTIGAIPVAMIFFRSGPGELALRAAMASPFMGVGYFSAMIGSPQFGNYGLTVASAIFWSVFYVTAAGGLLAATLLTFNRCLGRLPDRPARPRLKPPASMRRISSPMLREWWGQSIP